MLCGFSVAQAGQSHLASLGAGLGGVQGEAVESGGLESLDLGQQVIGLGQIAGLDRLLRLGFQGRDLGIVARLGRGGGLQGFEALGHLDQLCGELLGRNVGLAQNAESCPDLALVEVELFLQKRDLPLLGGREFLRDVDERRELFAAGWNRFSWPSGSSWRTPRTSCARLSPVFGFGWRPRRSRPTELADELDAAEREAERLASLLTALLTLAREGDRPPARQAISAAEALERARERWDERAALGGHRLDLDCRDPGLAAVSDEDLAIILDNLVENALVYAPDGGTVIWECGREGPDVVVAVADEGPGLEPGEEEQVFERFARGSGGQGTPGTGLGLVIVATLARRWGGAARIANRATGGAQDRGPLPGRSGVFANSEQELGPGFTQPRLAWSP